MKTFEELGLNRDFISVLENARIKVPTEIQEKAIPLALAGRDILGGSATGSGKTLVFASPIIEYLKPNNHVQALILTPTRELAEQVSDSIKKFSKNKSLGVLPVYGGVNIDTQIRNLYKTDVIVGTPGRILDHLGRRTLSLRYVKYLVLDEVDRMFDMGFYRDVEKILRECPKERQTMLFSATISEDVYHIAKNHTKNPARVSVESHVDASKLKQIYYNVEHNDKFSFLVYLLEREKSKRVLVFCSTRRNVDFVIENLIKQKIKAKAIHGGMDQKKRTRTLNEFHESGGVLVCTDVAARGLDIKGVSHVYNYDLSKTSEEYIHRIGRTARAGENGEAINILASRDYENFSNIQRDEKLNITLVETPNFPKIWVDTGAFKSRPRGGSFSRSSRDSPGRSVNRFWGSRHSQRSGPSRGSRDRPERRSGERTSRGRSGGDGRRGFGNKRNDSRRSFGKRR
ncbi:MAG: DEAD/DEAH box helicase [Nanoarchaeota archaeon]|nr:DEAD/DEAH box helicase [Nanoarchaeota archaeon]